MPIQILHGGQVLRRIDAMFKNLLAERRIIIGIKTFVWGFLAGVG